MGNYWGCMWHQKNSLDGERKYLVHRNCVPVLLRTKKEAQIFIETNYGYIRHRKDLRREPHGWRLPKPVRVTIQCTTMEGNHENITVQEGKN